ncbi:MAG TPA: Mur ligase domain-containing protein, partial [Acidimicrobiia bacterium]|nr:Mur ligase domain-containing protein [Acidimicrobiia bacterium]
MSHNSAVSLTLDAPRALHVVGIGGAGMSGIATVLHRMGHRVSGSDLKESPVVERLRAQGIDVAIGHAAEHLPSALDAVVVSTAIRPTNPEVVAAGDRGVPVLRRAEALRLITDTRRTLAVSGTHGKTTTSSLVTLVLREAGWHPSFLVGGELNEVGGNAFYDEGEWLVVEADESDGTFVELSAEAVVVTNVEPDHLDHYGGFEPLVEAFDQFVREADLAVVCADDAEALAIARRYDAVTYGFSPDADYVIGHYEAAGSGSRFVLSRGSETVGRVELSVPGRHNASNATAAAAVALELGAEFEPVASALRR